MKKLRFLWLLVFAMAVLLWKTDTIAAEKTCQFVGIYVLDKKTKKPPQPSIEINIRKYGKKSGKTVAGDNTSWESDGYVGLDLPRGKYTVEIKCQYYKTKYATLKVGKKNLVKKYPLDRKAYEFETVQQKDGTLHIDGIHLWKESPKKITVPAKIDGKKVTQINDNAFIEQNLEEVAISEGIKKIGKHAFETCVKLKKVTVPVSLDVLGEDAFMYCSSLKTVIMKGSIRVLGEQVFDDCISLALVDLKKGIQEIGDDAFRNCSSLKEITIPSTVKKMGHSCFARCEKLKKVTVEEGVEALGNNAFEECSSLKEVTLPKTLKELGGTTFGGCTSLETIELPSGIKTLAAFSGCASLKAIQIPGSVEKVGSFAGCTSLVSVELPEGIKELEDNAFQGCTALKEITIPATVKTVGVSCFEDCECLEDVYFAGSKEELDAALDAGLHNYWEWCKMVKQRIDVFTNVFYDNVTVHYNAEF